MQIIRLITANSHYQFREYRQLDKSVLDMATRSFTPPVQELLVKLLNEANTEVKKVHSSIGKVAEYLSAPEDTATPEDTAAPEDAAAAPEDAAAAQEPKQKRRAPERFGQESLTHMDHDTAFTNTSDSDYHIDLKEDSEFSGFDEEDEKTDNNLSNFEEFLPKTLPTIIQDLVLETQTTKRLRQDFSRLTHQEQEAFNQEDLYIRQLLSLSPEKTYTTQDLTDDQILDRALCLLYVSKFGQEEMQVRISPHIKYDKLPSAVSESIRAKMQPEETQVREALELVEADCL